MNKLKEILSKKNGVIEDEAKELQKIRKTILNFTQQELGGLFGVSDTTVVRWEAGSLKIEPRFMVRLEMLKEICKLVKDDIVNKTTIKQLASEYYYSIDLIYAQIFHEKHIISVPQSIDPKGILCHSDSKLLLKLVNLISVLNDDDEKRIRKCISLNPDSINEPDVEGATPLMKAASKGFVKITKLLISHDADVSKKMTITKEFQKQMVINKGKNPAFFGNTALHFALFSDAKQDKTNKIKIVNILLENGADPNAIGYAGQTPLFLAASNHFPIDVLKKLLSSKANLDATHDLDTSCTPMMAAILYKAYDQAKFLIEAGTDLDIQDNKGFTALHYAVVQDTDDIVELLIKKGADQAIKNNDGETPTDLAKRLKCSVLKILESHTGGNK